MQSINNFLCEKFKINSQDLKHIHSSLFSEIQNEICDEGEYHTFDFNEGQKKYKKGFLFFVLEMISLELKDIMILISI